MLSLVGTAADERDVSCSVLDPDHDDHDIAARHAVLLAADAFLPSPLRLPAHPRVSTSDLDPRVGNLGQVMTIQVSTYR